ncbi:hypothetical protein GW819_01450 [Candidatus Gracilibacteria bacterium]|nr:hypothetical protein [bacterium]NDK19485.1 hypothetical protein [Candidatus Gracilibacteria bacterium]OIO78175.1 MAG: hypothetical protein AUJ87_00270 [Candidatus Gracilibacteria bacterium CG1_02_38_174]PIQ10523.1 MAG: hypothetical protein COW68_04420 [Candidatus Gracilibacteria bacterium CG18_big_fil_WC_8_21_14_2_50_38_16]PIQ41740.1 MAG: hypothetical protein COW06_02085 [Candidatus Gracilibacteria bacterium CG12_big_fil_rev_8_21_14_0_65_38_15]PIZ01773.1 MAG: hypothetical protein COY60_0192
MTPSAERDSNVFNKQPDHLEIRGEIANLLEQFGGRVERLTAVTLSPEERAIVDTRLLRLEMDISKLEANHRAQIATILGAANDTNYPQAA